MIVDSSHLISSPWLKYAWVSSHHELIIYCLNVHVNTKILLDNPAVTEALPPQHKYNSGQFGDNHNFGRAEGGLDHC